MLYGCDISHHNSTILTNYNKYDFYIMKATEGKTYVDPRWRSHLAHVLKANKLYGFYHYARPENNSSLEEAKHFVNQVGKYAGNAIFALDWEQTALKYDITWALNWLNSVYDMTGVRPVIYIQASECKRLNPILDNNYGLWVAQWNSAITKPNTGVYPYYALWQYTNNPIDLDIFNGNVKQWNAYCKISR